MSNTKRIVALVGNPNTGKTTLFNALTGLSQRTGNFPGCTVEKKTGALKLGDIQGELVDLPGTYSLAAASPDELVVADFLLRDPVEEGPVEAIVVVADACTLHRNLYLVTQIMELGLPMIMALNMTDLAAERNLQIDVAQLSKHLGFPVVSTNAASEEGLDHLRDEITTLLKSKPEPKPFDLFPEIHEVGRDLVDMPDLSETERHGLEHDTFRALLDEGGCSADRIAEQYPELSSKVAAAKDKLRDRFGRLIEHETSTRYAWIREQLKTVLSVPEERVVTFSDRVDKVLTHKLLGMAILMVVLAFVFQTIYTWAGPLMDGVEGLLGSLGEFIGGFMADGMLKSLIVDGVIAGVGGVLVFLPQIILLFLFIAILEDCGYMSRAAFLMDRIFRGCGLSGKSLIPLLSSFACAIPGLMATRTIEDRRDRLTTVFVAPFMSCSARLPVYVIMIAAFIPDTTVIGPITLQGLSLFGMYLVGVSVAIPTAWILKRTLLKGRSQPFLMELPAYKMPSMRTVAMRVYSSGRAFILRAGTVILAVTIVVWALSYFPRSGQIESKYEVLQYDVLSQNTLVRSQTLQSLAPNEFTTMMTMEETEAKLKQRPDLQTILDEAEPGTSDQLDAWIKVREQLEALDKQRDGEHLENSVMGRMGHFIEPIVKPLGWDWRIGMATLASFPAREIIIATLGIIYNLGGEEDEESDSLKDALKKSIPGDRGIPVALSIMVFFALCAQCAATLAVIRKEAGGWHWAGLSFAYMTTMAYIGALITYHLTMALGWGS